MDLASHESQEASLIIFSCRNRFELGRRAPENNQATPKRPKMGVSDLLARRRREKIAYMRSWAPMRLALDTHGGGGGVSRKPIIMDGWYHKIFNNDPLCS